uniref:Uncharacterized protein n=1 Tax=Amphimedon queenslandica TaxID=400682 RepID=A0A1X7VM95_AMPQE
MLSLKQNGRFYIGDFFIVHRTANCQYSFLANKSSCTVKTPNFH